MRCGCCLHIQGYEPGQWGPDSKADSSVLAKRKIVRAARRGPAAVAPSPAQAAVPPDAVAPSDEVAPANPFAGRSLTAGAAAKPVQLANPFAGVSLVAAAKVRPVLLCFLHGIVMRS